MASTERPHTSDWEWPNCFETRDGHYGAGSYNWFNGGFDREPLQYICPATYCFPEIDGACQQETNYAQEWTYLNSTYEEHSRHGSYNWYHNNEACQFNSPPADGPENEGQQRLSSCRWTESHFFDLQSEQPKDVNAAGSRGWFSEAGMVPFNCLHATTHQQPPSPEGWNESQYEERQQRFSWFNEAHSGTYDSPSMHCSAEGSNTEHQPPTQNSPDSHAEHEESTSNVQVDRHVASRASDNIPGSPSPGSDATEAEKKCRSKSESVNTWPFPYPKHGKYLGKGTYNYQLESLQDMLKSPRVKISAEVGDEKTLHCAICIYQGSISDPVFRCDFRGTFYRLPHIAGNEGPFKQYEIPLKLVKVFPSNSTMVPDLSEGVLMLKYEVDSDGNYFSGGIEYRKAPRMDEVVPYYQFFASLTMSKLTTFKNRKRKMSA